FCQFIKETGARPGEAWNLKWVDVNPQTNTVTINKPEKNSNPRVIKVSSGLIARLFSLPRYTEYVFKTNPNNKLKTLARRFQEYKKRIAKELQNPRLNLISFLSLRHFKATMEYKKTKDILHVKELLGHINIQNTLVYTHLVNYGETEYICKVAKNSMEAQQLIEAGFEYVCTTPEGLMLFRKPKVDVPRIKHGKRQLLDTLICEEALLLAKYLRGERNTWIPRLPLI
ncbi:MAG: tyrosine-type recombinase/integrase, partial [Candidatus Bathyarchaeia archaeon]